MVFAAHAESKRGGVYIAVCVCRYLADMFPNASPQALDLMRRLLKFNPNKRITAEVCILQTLQSCRNWVLVSINVGVKGALAIVQSLQEGLSHPYVAQFHNPADEPACEKPIQILIDDNTKYAASLCSRALRARCI